MKKRVAIIDMGTNTFHLLIADKEDGKHSIIHRERQAAKIGLEGINEGFITEAAIERALNTIRYFKKVIDRFNVSRILAFGTSALRNARNGEEVIKQIRGDGIDAKIISGEEEAQFIYYGVRSALGLGDEKSLIMDIGGGSVEFIIANQKEIFWKQSLEMGIQRLLENFNPHDPILRKEIDELDIYFEEVLKPVLEKLQQHRPLVLAGSSGTFDTLSDIYCEYENISSDQNNPEIPLTFEAFCRIYDQLIKSNRAQRMSIPGMIEMRVDMIVVACCLIHFILDRYTFKKIRVSTYSLKEGVLASLNL
jgi:exopolyphosphatase/guanosine-5'-triphosphate,3'-diphosphate pyrophosphatase